MPRPPLHASPDVQANIRAGLRALRDDLSLPDSFPPGVLAAAEAASSTLGLADGRERRDLTDVPFVTIDPAGSTDLDQAVWVEARADGGHRVLYAIADLAAFVSPGDAVDSEARTRGLTIYLPDGRVPLHPEVLSERAASLRAGQDRPALVWDITLDADGLELDARLERCTVRSSAELDYATVQRALDDGTAEDPLVALRAVGRRRQQVEAERGGVSLPLPDQEIRVDADGRMSLEFRHPLMVEGWNAQISLLAGMAAARIMVDAGIGILRTLPPPDERTLASLRADATALGVPWPDGSTYPDVIRGLDPSRPRDSAFAAQAARLLRGAGYLAFDGHGTAGSDLNGTATGHSAVAAPYAHVTAPLRRLVDRFGNEVVLSICAGIDPPEEVRATLPLLPELMRSARRRESAADGGARDLVERMLLADLAERVLDAVVVGVDDRGARVQIAEPAVLTRIDGAGSHDVDLGDVVRVRADERGDVHVLGGTRGR